MLKLKGDDPLWQASVPYDDKSSPPPPPSWYNNGKGGILLNRSGVVTGFSHNYVCGPGANATTFRASLLVTPVHNLNLTHHFSLRYAQLDAPANYSKQRNALAFVPCSSVPLPHVALAGFLASRGASVINMHQGNVVNPWYADAHSFCRVFFSSHVVLGCRINYPYLTNDLMNATSTEVHALGMRYSIYNTMRELSNRCAEVMLYAECLPSAQHLALSIADICDASDG